MHVELIMKSISPGSIPAAANARSDATAARSDASTCEMRRSFIPVRLVIHSSFVSTIFSRSAFESTVGGMAFPQPTISAFRITHLQEL